jgi:lysophospholipase L1-like esterase
VGGPRRSRLLPRLLLALAGCALALAAVELTLRLRYDALPSLAAVSDGEQLPRELAAPAPGAFRGLRMPLCRDGVGFEPRPPAWTARVGEGGGEPIALWAAGDSVNLGFGVRPEQSYAQLLARRLAEHSGRPVQLRNISVNGGSFCQYLRELNGHLALERPDLVMVSVFADDLADRALYLVDGVVVAHPSQAALPLTRALVARSYLANLLWITWRSRWGGAEPRFVSPGDQAWFGEAFAALDQRLQQAGVPLVLVQLAPVGSPLCQHPSPPEGCAALEADARLMASLLREHGLRPLDLSGFWEERPGRTLELEREELELRGALPIHPDPRGHAELAEALWPSLLSAWEASEPRTARGRSRLSSQGEPPPRSTP